MLQLGTMQEQLKVSREAATGQNFLALVNFLQNQEVRDARQTVITTLRSKPLAQWTKEDKQVADKVATTYDVAGMIIRNRLIPPELIVNNWSNSITKCYEALKPYIQIMQKRNGPNYFDDFDWLYKQAKTNYDKTD